MAVDIKAKIAALAATVKETGADLTKAQTGGDYVPPAAGPTRLRFIGYIEVGIHTTESPKFGKKTKPRAYFGFELSGPKHPPKVLEDGRKIPHVVWLKEIIGRHEKNGYMKLFKAMSKDNPGATNFVELLGNAYRAKVVHSASADGKRTYVNLKENDKGYTIESPTFEDPETGEPRTLAVDEPINPLKVFLWDYADLEQWDDIFIDGQYDDGASKNRYQEEIKRAENIAGSPIYELLVEAGREAELVPAPKGTKQGDGEAPDEDDEKTAVKAAAKGGKATPAKSELDAASDDADPLAGV